MIRPFNFWAAIAFLIKLVELKLSCVILEVLVDFKYGRIGVDKLVEVVQVATIKKRRVTTPRETEFSTRILNQNSVVKRVFTRPVQDIRYAVPIVSTVFILDSPVAVMT